MDPLSEAEKQGCHVSNLFHCWKEATSIVGLPDKSTTEVSTNMGTCWVQQKTKSNDL